MANQKTETQNPEFIADIANDTWINVTGKIVELWDNTHESIRQTGLLGDDTGIIKITSWEKSDLPSLREGETYKLYNARVSEYQGRLQLSLNSNTIIKHLVQTTVPVEPEAEKEAPPEDAGDLTSVDLSDEAREVLKKAGYKV